MPITSNFRRRFAIRASIAKREANTVILKNGVRVTITSANAEFAEKLRRTDAENAYLAASSGKIAV